MQVEVMLQGKGGVGKSFISSVMAQHYQERGLLPICIDTDPVNHTFAKYKAFNALELDITSGDDINPRAFDRLVETILGSDGNDSVFIADNGAATFVPLCSYILQNGVIELLREAGHDVRFHTVITGGQALADTLGGFNSLCENFPDVPVVVWINGYFGIPERDGKGFEDSQVFKKHQSRIHALISIPEVKKETFGQDMAKMLDRHLTFAEVQSSPDFDLMEKQRLKIIWTKLASQMDRAQL